MYVITGATGNTGSRIAETLLQAGKSVWAVGRSADRLKQLTANGAEVAVGSLEDVAFLEKTFKGAQAVYAMIPPNFKAENYREYQNRVADALAQAIKNAHVKYAVTLSSVGAHLAEKGGIVQGLYDMEQKFNKIEGLNVLHLRPSYFMENLLGQAKIIKQLGVLTSPLKGDLYFPMVATKDIADVATKHLLALDFTGSSVVYVLGERDVTYDELAKLIGKAIGKPNLTYKQVPYGDAKQAMINNWGITANGADAMIEFSESVNEGRVLTDVKRTSENTTPTSIEEFVQIFAQLYIR